MKKHTKDILRLLVLVSFGSLAGCGGGSAADSSDGQGGGPAAPIDLPAPGDPFYVEGLEPGDFVLVHSDVIVHEASENGYYNLTLNDFVNPQAPKNWSEPVRYSAGDFEMRLEVIDLPKDDAELYYSITFVEDVESSERGFLRAAIHVDHGEGVYSDRWRVRDTERSPDGSFGGPVGDEWTWTAAFRQVGADLICTPSTTEECFPGHFRVTLIVRAPK